MQLREREAAIAAALGASVAIVQGPAGIGKSAVLDELAQSEEVCVLRARGSPLEQAFPFGVVRQLLDRIAQGRELAPGARAVLRPEPGLVADLAVACHGLYWLLADLAEREPVRLVVDDAHWADDPSLQALSYLGARTDELGVRVVLAVRTGDPRADHPALAALRASRATTTLTLDPLSDAAAAALVEEALGSDAAEFVASVQRGARGNPLLIAEMVRLLGTGARTDGVGELRVEDTVLARMLPLSDGARRLAQAAAILGLGASPAHAARLADLEPETAAGARDTLVAAAVLADADTLEFVHPLVADAVAASLPRGRAALLNERAARLLDDAGAEPAKVAVHLLPTAPAGDGWKVARLRAAARDAVARGSPAAAVTLLRRALDEPPPQEERIAVEHELGNAESRIGAPGGLERLIAALERSTDPVHRAQIALDIGVHARHQLGPRRAAKIFDEAAAALPEDQPELKQVLAARAIQMMLMDLETTPEALARAQAVPVATDPRSLAERLLLAAATATLSVGDASAHAIVQAGRAALGDDDAYAVALSLGAPMYFVLAALARADDEQVERRLADALKAADARGSLLSRYIGLTTRAYARVLRGQLPHATADAELAVRLARQDAALAATPREPAAALVYALIEAGDHAGAHAILGDPQLVGDLRRETYGMELRVLRAQLLLDEGQTDRALEMAVAAGADAEASGRTNPLAAPWRRVAARAQHRSGNPDEAARLAGDDLLAARRFGTPRAIGIALHTCGMVAADGDDHDALRDAVATLADAPAPLERARALLDLGAALRRANRRAEARDPLTEARELAHGCGARRLAEAARTELLAAGARPRRVQRTGLDALTPSELRVVQLAADGRSNKAIAQTLYVTVKTVEDHLSRAYRKLDVRGRAELAAKLPGRPP